MVLKSCSWAIARFCNVMLLKLLLSSSKHDGLAGTRFGWALVKDEALAKNMSDMASQMILSSSVDIELRVLTSMQSILGMWCRNLKTDQSKHS